MPHAVRCIDLRAPACALRLIATAVPWLLGGALALSLGGLGLGFHDSGGTARGVALVVFLHVPATWAALATLAGVAVCSTAGLWPNARTAAAFAAGLAPTGALFAFLALWTGSLWGKPVWGSWMFWDLRIATDAAMLLVFLAIMAAHATLEDVARADRVAAFAALAGAALVAGLLAAVALGPGGHGHPASAAIGALSGRLTGMAVALTSAGLVIYAAAAGCLRARCVILERERASPWARLAVSGRP